jgi:hypothetical protein
MNMKTLSDWQVEVLREAFAILDKAQARESTMLLTNRSRPVQKHEALNQPETEGSFAA